MTVVVIISRAILLSDLSLMKLSKAAALTRYGGCFEVLYDEIVVNGGEWLKCIYACICTVGAIMMMSDYDCNMR